MNAFDLLAVDFHFAVVVHVVGGVAVAVKADVLSVFAFSVDELAVARVHVGLVGAFALLGRVVVVVVEECSHSGCKFRIVGDLHNNVMVCTCL